MDQINLLPEHILVDIFGYLTPKTIKRCTLVCKRWDEIISNSSVLMDKFFLIINETETGKVKDYYRKHQKIVINKWIGESLDVICQPNLRFLIFSHVRETVDSWKLLNLLKRLPLLKTFFAQIDITDYDISDEKKAQLDHLEGIRCNIEIIRLLNVKSLKNVYLDCAKDFSSSELFNFLKQQKYLQALSLFGPNSGIFFQHPDIAKLDFRLSKLQFICFGGFDRHEELIKFLQIQQKSLLSLDVAWFTMHSYKIVAKFILKNMINLKGLSLIINVDLQETPIEIALKLEKFTCILSKNLTQNRQILGGLKNLKSLHLCTNLLDEKKLKENLDYVGATMKDLETLEIDEIGSSEAYFSKLKELKVEKIGKSNDFNNFIRRHSKTLEIVEIEGDEDITVITMTELKSCENFKVLKVHSEITMRNLLRLPIKN